MENDEPVVVCETVNQTEAECIRQALDANNIPCVLLNENANKMIGLGGSLGIRILVHRTQYEEASRIIANASGSL